MNNSEEKTLKLNEKKLALLEAIQDMENRTIGPVVDQTRPMGYRYPVVEEIFYTDDENKVIRYLNDLVVKGLLYKTVQDKIHLCPYSQHHDINFREVCPQCNRVDIEKTEMIHHFSCGFVGPEPKYVRGPEYICPKCGKILRHIGVDYEKPSDAFMCHMCDRIFTSPEVRCFSMESQKSFSVDDVILRNIYSYTLTDQGLISIERGFVEEVTIENVFQDMNFKLYT